MTTMYSKVMRNRFNKALVLTRVQARNEKWSATTCDEINRIESVMNSSNAQVAYEYVVQLTKLVDDKNPAQAELTAMVWNVYWLMYLAQFNVNKFNRIWRQLSVDL